MNEDRLEKLENLAGQNRFDDDLRSAVQGDQRAIRDIVKFRHPQLFNDELFPDFELNVDMLLDEGKPNTLELYEAAAYQTYEENGLELPQLGETEVESLNEQSRFQRGVQEMMEARNQKPKAD